MGNCEHLPTHFKINLPSRKILPLYIKKNNHKFDMLVFGSPIYKEYLLQHCRQQMQLISNCGNV